MMGTGELFSTINPYSVNVGKLGFAMFTNLSIIVAHAACLNCSSNADLVGGRILSKVDLELKNSNEFYRVRCSKPIPHFICFIRLRSHLLAFKLCSLY